MVAFLSVAESSQHDQIRTGNRRGLHGCPDLKLLDFRGGGLTVLEGEWPHLRCVIIEFPSRAAAEDWYKSAEYRKIISLRLKSSAGNLIIVDGFTAQ